VMTALRVLMVCAPFLELPGPSWPSAYARRPARRKCRAGRPSQGSVPVLLHRNSSPRFELRSELKAARIGVQASDSRTILRAVNLSCSLHQPVVVRRVSSGPLDRITAGLGYRAAALCGAVICGGRTARLGPQARPGGCPGCIDMVLSRHRRRLLLLARPL
jgi:hypothetical protein